METLILNTHYGVVRYLYYQVFLGTRNQINDLQNQILYLKTINKYLLCRSGQYAQLYNQYTNLTDDVRQRYFDVQRLKMNINRYEWLNFSNVLAAPRILPRSVDGPYMVDNLALRRYTHFWNREHGIRSNIVATPFFCLDGVDHLHAEMVRWKSNVENIGIQMIVRGKHVFHDIFYTVQFRNDDIRIKFLVWLDCADMQTELYVAENEDSDNSDASTKRPTNLLRRLYLACDDVLFLSRLSAVAVEDTANTGHTTTDNVTGRILNLLNQLINNLSRNFVVSFDGRGPIPTKTAILNLTNNSKGSTTQDDNSLYFGEISRIGYRPDLVDQIYEIDDMSQLNLSQVTTPNLLIFQDNISVTQPPSITEMNARLQRFLYLLSMGLLSEHMYVRMYRLPASVAATMPNSAKYQLHVIYMQRYRRFDISREAVNYDPLFFDRTYVFEARHLTCTVKSLRYLVRDVIPSTPLMPACVSLLYDPSPSQDSAAVLTYQGEPVTWHRLTQGVIYLPMVQSVFFLCNTTIQQMGRPASHDLDLKVLHVVGETMMRKELNQLFPFNGSAVFQMNTVVNFHGVDLKRIVLDNDLRLELYYFARSTVCPNSEEEASTYTEDGVIKFKAYFSGFMHATQTKSQLNDRIYLIFMHMLNIYNNILL